jgi:hypothetical protein
MPDLSLMKILIGYGRNVCEEKRMNLEQAKGRSKKQGVGGQFSGAGLRG